MELHENIKVVEKYIDKHVNKYVGKSQNELKEIFNVHSNTKNINELIISKMFNENITIKKNEFFSENKIIPRTVSLLYNGIIRESIPLPSFEYTSLITQSWDNSDLKKQLLSNKYLFFIFQEIRGNYVFRGYKLWKMPEIIIEKYVKFVWEKTKNIVEQGKIVSYVDSKGIRKTNFPGMKDNYVCHVRPHARDKNDTFPLPIMDVETKSMKYTKHSFWINASFIEKVIKGEVE